MLTSSQLQQMTVAQLRKYAKDQGIVIPAGMLKAHMIDKILASTGQPIVVSSLPSTPPVSAAPSPVPVRRATIIADDDDLPVMTANKPMSGITEKKRPSVSAPKPVAPPPKGNKPAFDLSGARAWHNPQQFSNQPAPSETPRAGQPATVSSARPTVNRFGPQPEPPKEEPIPAYRQHVYRSISRKSPALNESREARREYSVPALESISADDIYHGEGVLETLPDGYGFLRTKLFMPSENDIYVSAAQIRRFRLRQGDLVGGKANLRKSMDKYSALLYITSVNGQEADEHRQRRSFDDLTALDTSKRLRLSSREHTDPLLRSIDLYAPVGFGQRMLIKAQTKKETYDAIAKIAEAISARQDDINATLFMPEALPERITQIRNASDIHVVYTTFDRGREQTQRLGELVMERAKRVAEDGKDVVLLISDYAAWTSVQKGYGPSYDRPNVRLLSQRARRILGAARTFKEGGSVTVIAAVALEAVEESPFFLKDAMAVANSCATIESGLVKIPESFTFTKDKLLTEDELNLANKLEKFLEKQNESERQTIFNDILTKTNTNRELANRIDSWLDLLRG